MQFFSASSREITALFGSSALVYLKPTKPITVGTLNSAQASMVSRVYFKSSSRYAGLLKPFLKPPGAPLEAIAISKPCFFTVANCAGRNNSTEVHPTSLAFTHNSSKVHLSPLLIKHHEHALCLILPLRLLSAPCA